MLWGQRVDGDEKRHHDSEGPYGGRGSLGLATNAGGVHDEETAGCVAI